MVLAEARTEQPALWFVALWQSDCRGWPVCLHLTSMVQWEVVCRVIWLPVEALLVVSRMSISPLVGQLDGSKGGISGVVERGGEGREDGPVSQRAGQVKQPQGAWMMSKMKRPEL
jgi:hypothetical protein